MLVRRRCLSGVSLAAQSTGSLVTISTSVPGMRFSVDGILYHNAAAFTWPTGSKHILDIPPGDDIIVSAGTKTAFTGWVDTSGKFTATAKSVTITADPSITGYIANYSQLFQVSLQFADGRVTPPSVTPTCGQPGDPPPTESLTGVVNFNGGCYWSDFTTWIGVGAIPLQAFPYPGYVFAGWSLNGVSYSSFVQTVPINGPTTILVRFARAQRTQFMTDPPALKVLVDRQTVPTPTSLPCPDRQALPPLAPASSTALCFGEFDFLPGSQHVISAPSPQRDGMARYWVFSQWSTGGGQNTTYVAPSGGAENKLVAKFVPGVGANLATIPAGLKLVVDGRDNWPALYFIWGVGMTYNISAPSQQSDAKGRKYVFVSWSNGGSQTQDILVPASAATSPIRLVATYQRLSRAVVQSNMPGLTVMIDGKPCVMPCNVDRASGSKVTVSPSKTIPVSDVTRYDFTGSSFGTMGDTSLTLDRDYQVLQLNYQTMNRMLTTIDPAGGADVLTQPASTDGFYPATSQLVVTAKAHPGFKFIRWDGDLSGTYSTGYLDMGAPRLVRVILNRVPYIAPAGVRNAAGETPEPGVAAGSLISIFGESLSEKYVAGTSSPLAQTLGDVVVQVEDRLLPLVYVSPQQINGRCAPTRSARDRSRCPSPPDDPCR